MPSWSTSLSYLLWGWGMGDGVSVKASVRLNVTLLLQVKPSEGKFISPFVLANKG